MFFDPFDLSNLITSTPCATGTCHVLDQSVTILGRLFGSSAYAMIPGIDQVQNLPSKNSLISDIIANFDLALAAFIVLLYGYILVSATVNTAHDGKAFGQRNHTTWTLIRSIIGPALLLPKTVSIAGTVVGFSLIQGTLMWIILSGVSMADYVWSSAVKDIFFTPPANIPTSVNDLAANELGKIFVYGAVEQLIAAPGTTPTISTPISITLPSGVVAPLVSANGTITDKTAFAAFMGDLSNMCQTYAFDSRPVTSTSPKNQMAIWSCQDAVDVLSGHQPTTGYTDVIGPDGKVTNKSAIGLPMDSAIFPWAVGRNSLNSSDNTDLMNPSAATSDDPTAAKYMQFKVSYGNNAAHDNGMMNVSGGYNITPIGTNGPQTNAYGLNLVDVYNQLNADGYYKFVNTPCTGTSCSLQNVIGQIEVNLQKQLNADTISNNSYAVVPGTGDSCEVEIRTSAGVPATAYQLEQMGITSASTEAPSATAVGTVNGTAFYATNECYQKIEEPGKSKFGFQQTTAHYEPIPASHYNSSWWYGSEVYLDLNKQISNKIKNLVLAMQSFDIDSNSLNLGAFTGSKSTSLSTKELIRTDWGAVTTASVLHAIPETVQLNNDQSLLALPTWSDLTCVFQVSDTGGFMDQNNCAIAGNIQNLSNLQTNQDNKALSGDGTFYQELQQMPADYRNAIKILLVHALIVTLPTINKGGNTEATYEAQLQYMQTLKTHISNIIQFLQYNHIYPGSQTPGSGFSNGLETSAGRDVLVSIFNKILGNNTAGAAGITQFGGLMNDVYSLGQTTYAADPSNPSADTNAITALLASSFSSIAQAQRIGLEMINTVVGGFQGVYGIIKTKADGYIQKDNGIYQNAEDYVKDATHVSYAAGIPIAGSIASGIADIYKLKVMGDQIELQNQMVSQSYNMSELLMWLPLIITVMTSLFVAGVSFAIIVPITPFILFWAGQIAWVLSVLEAIVAAPLLVLAYTTPGGHEHFGHTMPGFRILIGVVLRPVLMVIGLVVGMILTYTLIHFSSQAFQVIAEQILSFASSMSNNSLSFLPGTMSATQATAYAQNASITQGILSVLMLLMFCSFMVMAFNKCFSTIYYIPEKVLTWIGGQMEKAGAQEAEQLGGGVKSSAEKGGSAGGQSLSQGGQAQAQHAQQSGSADSSNAGTGLQMAGTAGDASSQFGNAAKQAGSMAGGGGEGGDGGSVGS